MEKKVLWQSANERWTLSENPREDREPYIVLDDGWMSVYPILYNDSNLVAYDRPDIVPEYVHKAVVRTLISRRDESNG